MNLDGGKSAQMWMNGRIMNSPCQGEDTVASSLLVVRSPKGVELLVLAQRRQPRCRKSVLTRESFEQRAHGPTPANGL